MGVGNGIMGFPDIKEGQGSWGPWTESFVKGPYSDEEKSSLNGVSGRSSNSPLGDALG